MKFKIGDICTIIDFEPDPKKVGDMVIITELAKDMYKGKSYSTGSILTMYGAELKLCMPIPEYLKNENI